MKFVVTGILDKLTRTGAEQMIKDHGHEVSDTVRRDTNFLVAGIRPGSKLDKAKTFGVKVVNEDEFMKIMSAEHAKARQLVEERERSASYASRLPRVPPKPYLPDTIPGVLFMIGEVSYDYDDQYYSRSGTAVDPKKLYRSRSRAEREMATLEQKQFDQIYEHDLMMYCPEDKGFEDMFTNYNYFRAAIYPYGVELPEDGNDIEYGDDKVSGMVQLLCKLSVDKFADVKRFIKFSFYEIKEVRLGD